MLDVQYKKCKNKIKKIWCNITHEVLFEYMYKVKFLHFLTKDPLFLE
jgi:hypothetical protein